MRRCNLWTSIGPTWRPADLGFEFEGQPYFEGFRTLATNGVDKPVLNFFRMAGLMAASASRGQHGSAGARCDHGPRSAGETGHRRAGDSERA